MRVRTLIATVDGAYTRHISEYISEHHADALEIGVCNTVDGLREMLSERRYDVVLIDPVLIGEADLDAVELPILLWSEGAALGAAGVTIRIKKHQRISITVAEILEQYASFAGANRDMDSPEGTITVIWSPSGGVGKTTVALAYAASRAASEKEVFYLNLESFSSTPVYFGGQGKSISAVFEVLESSGCNVKMLIQGIRGFEDGIWYLCAPDNFDDICILSPQNVRELVTFCAGTSKELVIDLSSTCDMRTRQVFEHADKVLLVTDSTDTAITKLAQFVSQSDVYKSVRDKITLVVNRHAALTEADKSVWRGNVISETVVFLPRIQATDEKYIHKELAGIF